jgi:hypothetical protein
MELSAFTEIMKCNTTNRWKLTYVGYVRAEKSVASQEAQCSNNEVELEATASKMKARSENPDVLSQLCTSVKNFRDPGKPSPQGISPLRVYSRRLLALLNPPWYICPRPRPLPLPAHNVPHLLLGRSASMQSASHYPLPSIYGALKLMLPASIWVIKRRNDMYLYEWIHIKNVRYG